MSFSAAKKSSHIKERTTNSPSKATRSSDVTTNTNTKDGRINRHKKSIKRTSTRSNRSKRSKEHVVDSRASNKNKSTSGRSKRTNSNDQTNPMSSAHGEESVEKTALKYKQAKMPDNAKFDAMKMEQLAAANQEKDIPHIPAVDGVFDRTQWENTEWLKPNNKMDGDTGGLDTNFPAAKEESPAGAIVGENLQNAVEHGEYLLDFPALSICMDFVEILLAVIGLALATIAIKKPGAFYMPILNVVLIILLLVALIAIQWKALHVRKVKDPNQQVRFVIDPRARRFVAGIHFFRLAMACSTLFILVYYVSCGDERLGIRAQSVCESIPASKALLGIANGVFTLQISLIIMHLVFYFQNRLSVRWFC